VKIGRRVQAVAGVGLAWVENLAIQARAGIAQTARPAIFLVEIGTQHLHPAALGVHILEQLGQTATIRDASCLEH